MANIDDLRAGGVAHPDHDFSDEDMEKIESLTPEEVAALISARQKLGHDLCKKDPGDAGDTHPVTFVI